MTNNPPSLTRTATSWLAVVFVAAAAWMALAAPGAAPADDEKTGKSSEPKIDPAGDDKPKVDPIAKGDEKPSPEKPSKGDSKPSKDEDDKEKEANKKASREARAVLKSARDKLLNFRSIKAKLVETIALGERRFRAEGSYVQGSNLRLRLELTVKSGSLVGTLLEVCDGQVLYAQYSVGATPRITRRDVRQILDAAKAAAKTPENMLVAEIGLGGLPALLASVEQSMSFTSVREDTIDGQSFTVLEGGWGKQFMNNWNAANPKSKNRLPEHIPDGVRIYFDAKTLLPRRFLYFKVANDKLAPRPMVTLDFVDLVLNAPISDDEFTFVAPDDVQQDDITRAYLDRFRGPDGESLDKTKPAQPPKK